MPNKIRGMLFIAVFLLLFILILVSNKSKSDTDDISTSKTTSQTIKVLKKQSKELSWSIEYYTEINNSTLDILSGTLAKVQALKLQASDEQANIQQLQEKKAQVDDTIAILLGDAWPSPVVDTWYTIETWQVDTGVVSMWEVGHDGRSKPLPPIIGNTKEKRFVNFVRYYAKWFDESVFVNARRKYWIKEELLACIAWAETSLWLENKSSNNIMNYGNNDRWDTKSFSGVQSNVNAAAWWMSQGLLSSNKILAEMSWHGREEKWLNPCSNKGTYCYATSDSKWYWRINVNNCLTFIEWEKKDWDNMVVVPWKAVVLDNVSNS